MAFIIEYSNIKQLETLVSFECVDTCCCFEFHMQRNIEGFIEKTVVKAESTGRDFNGQCVWEFTWLGTLYYVWFVITTGDPNDTYAWAITTTAEGITPTNETLFAVAQEQSPNVTCPINSSLINGKSWEFSTSTNFITIPCPTDFCNSLCGQVCFTPFG